MKFNNKEEMIEKIGEEFLWNIISEYVENDVQGVRESVIENVGNIDLDMIEQIASLNILESEEFLVTGFSEHEHKIAVEYEMPAIIMADSADKKILIRVQTACTGTVEVPDLDAFDWQAVDFENMHLPEILSYRHLANILSVSYEYTEADLCQW